jgi:two-component SAPR family response regulator
VTIFSKPSVGLNELKLSSQKYSLVLIDFTSQVKNSTRNFPKQIKDINDKIKIILISGFHFNESYISRQGYDQYLKLPVTMSKLVNLIKETLAKQSLDPIFG